MLEKHHPGLSVGAKYRLLSIYQKPATGQPAKGHRTCPSLPGGLRAEWPNRDGIGQTV